MRSFFPTACDNSARHICFSRLWHYGVVSERPPRVLAWSLRHKRAQALHRKPSAAEIDPQESVRRAAPSRAHGFTSIPYGRVDAVHWNLADRPPTNRVNCGGAIAVDVRADVTS